MSKGLENKLRDYAYECWADDDVLRDLLISAADTIEALSAKLAKENMERSGADCGCGWIPCSERLPKECESVLISVQLDEPYHPECEICCGYMMGDKWYAHTDRDFFEIGFKVGNEYKQDKVVAWRPLPEPYTENEK